MSLPSVGRFAVLASGSGTNLQALIDGAERGEFQGELGLVITNRPHAGAAERATRHGIPHVLVDHTLFSDRASFEATLVEALKAADVELVVLAGFMRVLTPRFVHHFAGRIINIHPSLLPEFPGRDGVGDALEAGVSRTGVTVHYVDEGVDTGAIIAQVEVPIRPGDDRAALLERIHAVEHELYPRVIKRLLRERPWRVSGEVSP